MTRGLLTYAVVPLVLCACATPCAAAAGVADVRTVEDLRNVPAIRTADGWDVRVGLGEPAPAAGPYRLLYCLARHTGDQPTTRPRRVEDGEPLGPLSYVVDLPGRLRQRSEILASSPRGAFEGDVLYVASVPLSERGTHLIRVSGADGTVIAERAVEVVEPRPAVWQTFASLRRLGEGEDTRFGTMVSDTPRAAMPAFCGSAALLPGSPPATSTTTAPPPRVLPGITPAPRLRLALANGHVVVRADARFLSDWVDAHLLARWWVNQRAVAPPPPGSGTAAVEQARQVGPATDEVRVAFGLPKHLGELRVGDHVSLQVAHSAFGHRAIVGQMQMLPRLVRSDVPVLTISNRLDFELTPEMVDQVERDRRATTRPS